MDARDKLPMEMLSGWRDYEKELEKMSPFEIKNKLIDYAQDHSKKAACTFLNAGRGNPNWIATVPREAFFLLGKFGLSECRRVMDLPEGIAGIPLPYDITGRFEAFMKENASEPGADLLQATYDWFVSEKKVDSDKLLYEWAEAIIGDQYPVPDRILNSCEIIVHDYLIQEMCDRQPVEGRYDLFATEGGTAGMCYAFNSLVANHLLKKGDHIAIFTPIFTPYLEIPELSEFDFKVTEIKASQLSRDGDHTWQYPDEEIDKLKDPSIKMLCVVNPSNPPSYEISEESLQRLIRIVKVDNPNLMIVTDDVYGTFVPHFRSLLCDLPANTLCVYSFSKYFGATGWRLAVTALHQDNIYDKMIAALPQEQKEQLNGRYGSITLEPEKLKFIDRMVADSRLVALNHTAGLSTPQQMQMVFFAAAALLDRKDTYKKKMYEIIQERLETLWENTGFELLKDEHRAGYYSEIDMLIWAEKFYGKEFADYLNANFDPLDFVIRLAKENCVVLLNGSGFDGPVWSIRVSLANLNKDDYALIGKAIRKILDEYEQMWKSGGKGKTASQPVTHDDVPSSGDALEAHPKDKN